MSRILLVEDDKNISDSLAGYLEREGFQTDVAFTIQEARLQVQRQPDLVILDWMLTDGQGIDYLRELLRERREAKVILLTSRTDLVDKVLGLECGAVDYITKPFEPRELLARIRVQLRTPCHSADKRQQDKNQELHVSGVRMDLITRQVEFCGRSIELSRLEFSLLQLLLENPNRVFPREALLNQVWGYENYPTTRTVDNHIVLLRQKLDPSLIETVRGIGYRFRASQAAIEKSANK